ncbi:MAG: 23S rRNA (adenine(1618)-N(6))-methyltransferase RlmF [Saprospiraceae bacterium]
MKKATSSPTEKTTLHPRNKHRLRYDFTALCKASAELIPFVIINERNVETIDFFNPQAVKALNKAILKLNYGIELWNIPEGYLCPPIPGRADYIHYMADLFQNKKGLRCLDIGVGANCIYPIIGVREYGWTFVGSEIDMVAVRAATAISKLNPALKGKIDIRIQSNKNSIFKGIVGPKERFDLVFCNPPFHSSLQESQSGTIRKLNNLKDTKVVEPVLNFGGVSNELWCVGGEKQFVKQMIDESVLFKNNCLYFSCLISKQSHLEFVYRELKRAGVVDSQTIPMGQGNKISRIVVWTFQSQEQIESWKGL